MSNNRFLVKTLAVVASCCLALGAVGCGGGKPSKDAVTSGLVKALGASAGTDETAVVEKMAKCIVDASYDKVSEEGLKILAEGNVESMTKMSEADTAVMSEASLSCMELSS